MHRSCDIQRDAPESLERPTDKRETVAEELAAIRQTLDAIREDLAWWLRNNRRDEWLPIQPLTSMPLDPTAPDWASRLNRHSHHDLPPDCDATSPPAPPGPGIESPQPADSRPANQQQALFGDE